MRKIQLTVLSLLEFAAFPEPLFSSLIPSTARNSPLDLAEVKAAVVRRFAFLQWKLVVDTPFFFHNLRAKISSLMTVSETH